eukprot:TRINITY_DN9168_c0_g2_i1.p1 TRINITY_DN9168_c0_g2~~TRINITY_DN9168_c0_g2_i1.p1  ORF type:complete len:137 (-),score=17.41 TRINITY_DN9168_c0_g2_i1:119-529(-)
MSVNATITTAAPTQVQGVSNAIGIGLGIALLVFGCCCLCCLCACACFLFRGVPARYQPRLESALQDMANKGYLPKLNDAEGDAPSQLGNAGADKDNEFKSKEIVYVDDRPKRERPRVPVPIPAPVSEKDEYPNRWV